MVISRLELGHYRPNGTTLYLHEPYNIQQAVAVPSTTQQRDPQIEDGSKDRS